MIQCTKSLNIEVPSMRAGPASTFTTQSLVVASAVIQTPLILHKSAHQPVAVLSKIVCIIASKHSSADMCFISS